MWNELWESHRGKLIGVAAGVFFGFIYLFFGFWDMLIFGFIVLLGIISGTNWIGKKVSSFLKTFGAILRKNGECFAKILGSSMDFFV